MKRGDILVAAPFSPFNKPRPVLVIQAEVLDDGETVLVAPITGDLSWSRSLRVPVQPSVKNGLRKPSEIMIDLIQPVHLQRIGGAIGEMDALTLRQVDAA